MPHRGQRGLVFRQAQEALGTLAENVWEIVHFDADRDHKDAEYAESRKQPIIMAENPAWQRLLQLARHQIGQERADKIIRDLGFDKPKVLGAREFWDALFLGLFIQWPTVITYARILRDELRGQKNMIRTADDSLRTFYGDALTELELFASRGDEMLGDWEKWFAVEEWSDQTLADQVCTSAGAFSEYLREQGLRARLRALAARPLDVQPDKREGPRNETAPGNGGTKTAVPRPRRPPVKESVRLAMRANPKIHSPQQLLPHANKILKMSGFGATTVEQVKKNMSVLKKETKDARTP